ncbi:uncharacterized protein LOC110663273 [Hevea brasiliensis]|uniref:uncharacterized protein LOC110663273 n=1 Tax=Hevea brasiliensis TaxID=3981 RepID=UPI0025D71385|nr:uncharacterized protein LOC110663273 [Hevea brasiliensis]
MWMYNRLVPSRKGVITEFINGVRGFIEFALTQHNFVSNGSIKCPCSRCENSGFLTTDIITAHLYKFGFMPNYYHWVSHGEPFIPILRPESGVHEGTERVADSIPVNPYRTMVFEAVGPYFNFDCDGFDMDDEEEPPNRNAQDFFEMLRAAEEPLL